MIYGKKVTLRDLELEDIKKMSQWERNPDILFEDYDFPELSPKEEKLWFDKKTSYGKKCFVILEARSKLIGYIALRKLNPVNKTGEIGIVLNPAYHDLGYGTEAINTFLSWYFKEFGYKTLGLLVGQYNKRGIRCYEKVGFKVKKELIEEFNNHIVDLEEKEYEDIKDLFVITSKGIQAKCFKMIINREDYENLSKLKSGEKQGIL